MSSSETNIEGYLMVLDKKFLNWYETKMITFLGFPLMVPIERDEPSFDRR